MRKMMSKELFMKRNQIIGCLAIGAMFWACSGGDSDSMDLGGGASGDAGVTAVVDWEVAGVSQKGPFVTGSAVTVQELDGVTLKQTGKSFKGSIKSDKGDFAIKDINLGSQYAILEASGYYRDEISGKKSSGMVTLRALTDLSNRKTVNINLLTHLEYERVMYLVNKKKMSIADAKAQAEEEVLTSFAIEGDFGESEDLNIFESGDGNAALLAVSVLMQGDADVAGLTERIGEFSISLAEGGSWDDADTKTAIADWACDVDLKGSLSTVRKNVEDWKYADTVPAFEKYVTNFWWNNYGLGVCNDKRENETKRNINKLSNLYNEYFVCEKGRWHIPGDEPVSSSSIEDTPESSSSGISSSESSSSETPLSSKNDESSSSEVKSSSSYKNPFVGPQAHDSIPLLPDEVAFLENFFAQKEYKGYLTFEKGKQEDWLVSKMLNNSEFSQRESLLVAMGDSLNARGFEYEGLMLIDSALCLQAGDSSHAYVKKVEDTTYRVYVTQTKKLSYSSITGIFIAGWGFDLKIVAHETGVEENPIIACSSLRFEEDFPEDIAFLNGYVTRKTKTFWSDDSLAISWSIRDWTDTVITSNDGSSSLWYQNYPDSVRFQKEKVDVASAEFEKVRQSLVGNGFALVKEDTIESGTDNECSLDSLIRRYYYTRETATARYEVRVFSSIAKNYDFTGGGVYAIYDFYGVAMKLDIFYKIKPE